MVSKEFFKIKTQKRIVAERHHKKGKKKYFRHRRNILKKLREQSRAT